MLKEIFSLLLLVLLCGCNHKKDLSKLDYKPTKSHTSYIALTDSGFIFKLKPDEEYKYFEYSISKDEIRMYSDSLYDLACNIAITYPLPFYNNGLGRFRDRTVSKLNPTGEIINERYVYKTNFSNLNSPDVRIHIKKIEFWINGHEFDIELDSAEIRSLIPTFEHTLYTAKGL